MIKRTIEISQEPAYLHVRDRQLMIESRGEEEKKIASVPCEDIGVIVVDQFQTTYSHGALAALMEAGAAVVVCGSNHLPNGILLPLSQHTELVWRINDQLSANKPLRKQLWTQLVQAKIRAQAATIDPDKPERTRLNRLQKSVRSGDPSNVEAQAAKVYWRAWIDAAREFRRNPDGEDPLNAALNYGYAILRAAVGRALVAAGLFPALGLQHANRSNAFCLADDLMEPLRPLVDAKVRELDRAGTLELKKETKAVLLGVLSESVRVEKQSGPLLVAIQRMTYSLAQCFRGKRKTLLVPVWYN